MGFTVILDSSLSTDSYVNEEIRGVSPTFVNSIVKQENECLGEILEYKCDTDLMVSSLVNTFYRLLTRVNASSLSRM